MAKIKFWFGSAPTKCQLQSCEIKESFVDGVIRGTGGTWAIMCPDCHAKVGFGFGVGFGQGYEKTPTGQWMKVRG